MSAFTITAGTTGFVMPIRIYDSSSTTGSGLASLVYNTSGLTCKYRREGDSSWTSVTLAMMTAGTWVSGGFVESSSGEAGGYELGIPNAAIAAGAKWVAFELYGASNMLLCPFTLKLDAIDYTVDIPTAAENRAEMDSNSIQLSAIKGMAAYPGGFVYIHDSAGAAGTTVGTNGTISNPSNTVANAVTIANARGIKRLKLLNSIWGPLGGDVAFESVNLMDYIVDLNGSSITLANNVTTSRTTFLNGVIDKKGSETYISLDGGLGTSCRLTDIVLLSDVRIADSLGASSIPLMERVKFAGSVMFLGDSYATETFSNCGNYYYDYTFAGLDNPTVFNANGQKVLLRLPGWYGDAKITNMTDANSVFKFYGHGSLTIDATCTGGTVYYTPHISITDNSGGAVTLVPVSSAATDESITDAVWAKTIEGLTAEQVQQVLLAILSGVITTAGEGTEVFRTPDGNNVRVSVNVNEDGDRTSVTFSFD